MSETTATYKSFNAVLVDRGVLTKDQLDSAIAEAGKAPLDRFLLENKRVDPEAYLLAVAEYFRQPPIALAKPFVAPFKLIELADFDFWKKEKAIPLMKSGNSLTVAFGDPFDMMAQENVARTTHLDIIPLAALENDVADALQRTSQKKDSENPKLAMEAIMNAGDAGIEMTADKS